MKIQKYLFRLQLLENLIERGSTGSPNQIAKRLGISRSMLYKYIDYIKEKNGEITYSRKLNTFKYK